MDQTIGTWIVGLILVLVELVITTVVGLYIRRWWDKREKERAELEKAREEARQRELKDLAAEIAAAQEREMEAWEKTNQQQLDGMCGNVCGRIDGIVTDLEKIKHGMQKDIRRSLSQDAKFLCEQGWASPQDKTEFDELYWAYHNLGRNGVMDAAHEHVMHLPETPKGE